jgi:hypothetical protein
LEVVYTEVDWYQYPYTLDAANFPDVYLPTTVLTDEFVSMVSAACAQYAAVRSTKELKEVQPAIFNILRIALEALGRRPPPERRSTRLGATETLEDVSIPSGEYSVRGGRVNMSTLHSLVGEDGDDRRCRVFFRYSCQPDIEIGFRKFGHGDAHDASVGGQPLVKAVDEPQKDDEYFVAAVPPGEVKPNLGGFGADILARTQAAAYGVRLIMRVFPMLKESDLLRIFPDRHVYVPLMSTEHFYLIKVGVKESLLEGKFTIISTDRLEGDAYYRGLLSWLVWATNVVASLSEKRAELIRTEAINSWVPLSAYTTAFAHEQPGQLEPRVSFYNPIVYSSSAQRYYRIINSPWCHNGNIDMTFKDMCPELFVGWRFTRFSMSMPDLGRPLSRNDVNQLSKLKGILLKLFAKMKIISDAGYAHMDVRRPNVLLRANALGVVDVNLIDYDRVTAVGGSNVGNLESLVTPPEVDVHKTSDMWSFGIMLWHLIGIDVKKPKRAADGKSAIGEFCAMSDLVLHQERLNDFIWRCLIVDTSKRMTVDQAIEEVGRW